MKKSNLIYYIKESRSYLRSIKYELRVKRTDFDLVMNYLKQLKEWVSHLEKGTEELRGAGAVDLANRSTNKIRS